jgi:F-type H+/Na+-transporting ATPase subunit alpha
MPTITWNATCVIATGGQSARGNSSRPAYAQFEELETFARFGARLDESSKKTIEHGRRIRACLKQAQRSPVSVPAQIVLLSALSAELFDTVPIEKMPDAEQALLDAAASMSPDVRERLASAEDLQDADRETMLGLANKALAPFQEQAEA